MMSPLTKASMRSSTETLSAVSSSVACCDSLKFSSRAWVRIVSIMRKNTKSPPTTIKKPQPQSDWGPSMVSHRKTPSKQKGQHDAHRHTSYALGKLWIHFLTASHSDVTIIAWR